MNRKLIKFLLPFILLFACLGFAACDKGTTEPPIGESGSGESKPPAVQPPAQLSVPANLKVGDGFLTWDKVDFADGYSVLVNDTEYKTTQCRYDLSEYTETGVYKIAVSAYSNAEIERSEQAETDYAVGTKGLDFRFVGSGVSLYCTVYRFAVDENGVCIIPETYQDVPVKKFTKPGESDPVNQKIKTIYLPKTMEVTGNGFCNFSNLETVLIGKGHEKYYGNGKCVINQADDSLIVGCIGCEVPEGVASVKEYAFYGRNVTSVVLPESVTLIGREAFSQCALLEKAVLPSRILPKSVGERDFSRTFSGCKSLKEVNLPDGVERFTESFQGCTALKSVVLPETATELVGTFSGCTSLGDIEIPQGVTYIYDAFTDCTTLQEVVVPNGVTSLKGAFSGCTMLKKVNIPNSVGTAANQGNSYLQETFRGCSSLTSIIVPGSCKILKGTFRDCTSLKNAVLEEGVKQLDYNSESASNGRVFSGCSSLLEVTLPSTLETIPIYAFADCSSLRSVKIPEKVTEIGSYAFTGCTSLKFIEIPKGVTQISRAAFSGCTSLTGAILPSRGRIMAQVFENCPLNEVYFGGSETEVEDNLIISDKYNDELLSAMRYYYSETEPGDAGNFWHYVDGVPAKWA